MDQDLCLFCRNHFTKTGSRRKYCSDVCSAAGRKKNEANYAQKRIGQTTREQKTSPRTVCHEIDAGRAYIVNIDVPQKLSSWKTFMESYKGGMGKVVQFIKKEDRWIKQKNIEDWSLEKWNAWYENYKNVEHKTEAYYLMDVPVHSIHSLSLRNKNRLVDMFSYGGQYCFSRYIKMYSDNIPVPDVDYKAFIAPSWGQIMTYPHKDGHGTQLSVHCCMIGSGYNLVHCWPQLNMGQEIDFRKVLNIPPIGDKQEISHDISYDKGVDSSPTMWDVDLAEELAKKGIPSPTMFELRPGQAIVLPPNQYHSFKKMHNEQATMPLVGIACDCSYIGSSAEAFLHNYTSMKGLQNVHHWSDHVYCILELGLYCLFQSLVDADTSDLKNDSNMVAHARGAYDLFAAWVEKEVNTEAMLKEKYKIELPKMEAMINFDEDLTCLKCKLPLVNLFSYTTEGQPKHYCIDCFTNLKNRAGLKLMCRLKTPSLLQELLKAAKEVLHMLADWNDDFGKKRKRSNASSTQSNKRLKLVPETSNNGA